MESWRFSFLFIIRKTFAFFTRGACEQFKQAETDKANMAKLKEMDIKSLWLSWVFIKTATE